MNYVGNGKAPSGAHLAIGPDDWGQVIALPTADALGNGGAKLTLIADPNRPDAVVPVYIADLQVRGGSVKLVLKCCCGRVGCTRELSLKGAWDGKHPSQDDAAIEKLAKQTLGT